MALWEQTLSILERISQTHTRWLQKGQQAAPWVLHRCFSLQLFKNKIIKNLSNTNLTRILSWLKKKNSSLKYFLVSLPFCGRIPYNVLISHSNRNFSNSDTPEPMFCKCSVASHCPTQIYLVNAYKAKKQSTSEWKRIFIRLSYKPKVLIFRFCFKEFLKEICMNNYSYFIPEKNFFKTATKINSLLINRLDIKGSLHIPPLPLDFPEDFINLHKNLNPWKNATIQV